MAQHGYLHGEYDRDFTGDDDRSDRWRDRDEDRNIMFDRGDRERSWRNRDEGRWRGGREDDRGFFTRMGDEAQSWFRDDEDEGSRDRGRLRGRGGSDASEWFGGRTERQGGTAGFGGRSDWERSPRSFSSNRDDHYRSWRDKQMQALDQDYADYCREREQQFHSDFDAWRSQRQQDRGLRGTWGEEQGRGPDEQTFTPQTTAVGSTMTTTEVHEPQSTTEEESTSTAGTRGKR